MRVFFQASLILTTAILGGMITYGADPPCNFFTPQIQKYCKEPFRRCTHHVTATDCGNGGDQPAYIIPGCVYSGFSGAHCDSYELETECNRTMDCLWNENFDTCSEGDVNATPTYTTDYYSSSCVMPGG